MDRQRARLLRAKKIGVLLLNARELAGKSRRQVAEAIGVKTSKIGSYERGSQAPSLPELEAIAYFLGFPPEHFLGDELASDAPIPPTKPLPLPRLIALRQRILAATLRKERESTGFSVGRLARAAGLSAGRLRAYEAAEKPIPLPELESIAEVLGLRIASLLDSDGPLGEWRIKIHQIAAFLELPPELREFISKPVNRPYIELARRLSEMSAEKLRAVAEGLLEITL